MAARLLVLLLAFSAAAGCTGGALRARERLARELVSPAPTTQETKPPSREAKTQEKAAETGKQEEPERGGVTTEHEEAVRWERRDPAAEMALIRRHLDLQEDLHRAHAPRRLAVTGLIQTIFPTRGDALEGFGPNDPEWPELLEDGLGGGLELSYLVVPAVQPLLGVQFNAYENGVQSIQQGSTVIRQKADGLETLPFYAGLRLNFPLAMEPADWFDPRRAGRASGVIPFFRIAAGGSWSFGSELEITQVTSNPPITQRFDFVRRGFVPFAEAAVGVEYRARSGLAVGLSVGGQVYQRLRLDRRFRNAFPGVRIERLEQAFLPRLSATFYF